MPNHPFTRRSYDWKWPEQLDYERRGTTAIVTAPRKTAGLAPDLRALTLLEAAANGVLVGGGALHDVRVVLGVGWDGPELDTLMLRVGFLRAHGFPQLSLWLDGQLVATPNPVEGWRSYFDVTYPRTTSGGHELQLLARALDHWIALTRDALDAVWDDCPDGDLDELPWIRLETDDRRVHPRLDAIASRLDSEKFRVELPEKAERPRRSGLTARLEETSAAYREALKLPEGARRRRDKTTYPFVLPIDQAAQGIWDQVRPHLDIYLPVRHAFFHNLKSSQAFAVNLFGGLDRIGLLGHLVDAVHGSHPLDRPTLELELGRNGEFKPLLGESDHQTQVDAVVFATTELGREAFLFEVKLTEKAFGGCRGPRVAEEPARSLCSGGTAQARRAGCFLSTAHRRRYLEHAEAFQAMSPLLGADGGCPLRRDGYQLARNLIIAQHLERKLQGPAPDLRLAVKRARFFVLSARETPALANARLKALGDSPAERLRALGIGWVDAGTLVTRLPQKTHDQQKFVEFMRRRYEPIFDAEAGA